MRPWVQTLTKSNNEEFQSQWEGRGPSKGFGPNKFSWSPTPCSWDSVLTEKEQLAMTETHSFWHTGPQQA